MASPQQLLRRYQRYSQKQPLVAYGLPFFAFMLGGTYALTFFTEIRYTRNDRRVKRLTAQQVRELEADERLVDLRAEYQSLIDQSGADKSTDYQQKRVRRPWE